MIGKELNQNHHRLVQTPLQVFNDEASVPPAPPVYEFGSFRLDNIDHVLLRDGEAVPLTRKALEMLTLLVRHRGDVLEKDELLQRLWADTIVEEANLTQNIYLLRKALGQCARRRSYIQTVPKRGYRFVADVKEIWPAGAESVDALDDERRAKAEEPSARDNQLSSLFAAEIRARPALSISHRQPRYLLLVVAAFTICTCGTLAYTSMKDQRSGGDAARAIESIAVLPFQHLGVAGADAHLGLGMTDATITKLSALKQFSVLSTNSIIKFADVYELSVVGRELDVDAVLEGTVQRAGDRVRVTVRLSNIGDNQLLWTERFDAHFTDVFAAQDAVSEQIASALKLKLTNEAQQPPPQSHTQNVEADEGPKSSIANTWRILIEASMSGIGSGMRLIGDQDAPSPCGRQRAIINKTAAVPAAAVRT